MKRIFCIITIPAFFLFSCNDQQNKDSKNDTAKQPDAVQANTATENASKEKAYSQFNALAKLFGNDNYMILSGKDTNYIYFSRTTEYLIKTHSYKMVKGDSAEVKIDSIKLDSGNNLQWTLGGTKLTLKNNTDFNANWNIANTDSGYYQFQKTDNNTIMLVQSGGIKKTLKKTITLSTFLVRSFYDFEHGTRLAFDSTDFNKKTRKR